MKNKSNISYNVPFIFEKNIGQHHEDVRFVLKKNNLTTFFTQDEVVLVLSKLKETRQSDVEESKEKEYEVNVLRMNLENSNPSTQVIGLDEFNCKINYFIGKNIDDWIGDVPIYERVLYKDIYPGIDLIYYENEGILEHDFIVKPDGDLSDIKMVFEGYEKLDLDEEGNLNIYIKDEIVQMIKPRVYQEIGNKQEEVDSKFVIDEDKVSFRVSDYDKDKTLIIDPGLLYGSYLGGSNDDFGFGIAVDNNQNAYIVGYTYSGGFPTKNAYQGTLNGTIDVFLSRIDTTQSGSNSLIYSTYIGGSNNDYGYGIAVDNNQNAYITGYTLSSDFPTKNAYQSTLNGTIDVFLAKIDTTQSGLNSLIYSTYLGGSNNDYGKGVSVDNNQNAYITGYTVSSNFPTKNAYQSTFSGGVDAFLSKIDTTQSGLNSLIYSTYLGGSNNDAGNGVAVDNNQNAYITGDTKSSDFPTKNAYQSTLTAIQDVFLSKIDTTQSGINSLIYSTYLGGSNFDQGNGVAVDNNQNAYITGDTKSSDFPTKNAYQSTLNGTQDVFLIKIDTTQSGLNSLIYSTYLGGSSSGHGGRGVAVDDNQNAYITGYTLSSNFPTKNAYQNTLNGFQDAFLTKIDTTQSGANSLIYSTYLGGGGGGGGGGGDIGYGVAVDNNQNAYITGNTTSTNFPTQNAYQSILQGSIDAFLAKLSTAIISNKFADKNIVGLLDTITYTVSIANTLNNTATNVLFIDTIPTGTTFIPDSLYINGVSVPGKIPNPPGVTIPDINPGKISTITFSVNLTNTIPFTSPINNQGYFYFDTVQLSGTTIPGFSQTNIFTTTVSAAVIKTTLSIDENYATCADTVTYTIIIPNMGNVTAQNIVLTDSISSGTSFILNSVNIDGTTIVGANPTTGVSIPDIAAGSTTTVTYKVNITC